MNSETVNIGLIGIPQYSMCLFTQNTGQILTSIGAKDAIALNYFLHLGFPIVTSSRQQPPNAVSEGSKYGARHIVLPIASPNLNIGVNYSAYLVAQLAIVRGSIIN